MRVGSFLRGELAETRQGHYRKSIKAQDKALTRACMMVGVSQQQGHGVEVSGFFNDQ